MFYGTPCIYPKYTDKLRGWVNMKGWGWVIFIQQENTCNPV